MDMSYMTPPAVFGGMAPETRRIVHARHEGGVLGEESIRVRHLDLMAIVTERLHVARLAIRFVCEGDLTM